MTDQPWQGDACSLVDEFRSGARSPLEELEATYAAIDSSSLNAFSFLDPERARHAARSADVNQPFGGVPVGVKELEPVEGWPHTEASLVFKDRIASHTGLCVERLRGSGAVPVGLTTASEFGGLNVSVTKLNGVTRNPWNTERTVGGSSSGSAAAVAGGLLTLATAGDGGGSIRIPAGYTGLFGMKGTYGRIPRSPNAFFRPGTVVLGCMARSVRDVARYYDVCAGIDAADPTSLPSHGRWEADLGTHDLAGLKVGIVPDLSVGVLDDGIAEHTERVARELAEATGMTVVPLDLKLPVMAAQWAMGNLATLLVDLADQWPKCASLLTSEIASGLRLARSIYNLDIAAEAERQRIEAYQHMATAFSQVDLIMAATNPGPAFAAEATTSSPSETIIDRVRENKGARAAMIGALGATSVVSSVAPKLPNRLLDAASERFPDLVTMGALTIISNIYGNPAASLPAGLVDGLPVGLQVLAPHHRDDLLLDVALAAERHFAWPMSAAMATN